jgi:hypothetical protein
MALEELFVAGHVLQGDDGLPGDNVDDAVDE